MNCKACNEPTGSDEETCDKCFVSTVVPRLEAQGYFKKHKKNRDDSPTRVSKKIRKYQGVMDLRKSQYTENELFDRLVAVYRGADIKDLIRICVNCKYPWNQLKDPHGKCVCCFISDDYCLKCMTVHVKLEKLKNKQ